MCVNSMDDFVHIFVISVNESIQFNEIKSYVKYFILILYVVDKRWFLNKLYVKLYK